VLVILNGHSQAQHMVDTQPMKMAAAEALYESENPASFSLLTIGDLSQRREVFAIRIPHLLSFLAYNQLSGEVQGINDLQAQYQNTFGPGNYIPPVAVIYWSFRIMAGAGFAMAALGLYALFMVMGEMFENRPKVLVLFVYAMALPYLANTFGWLMTELGRAPWTVFGLIKLEDSVSPTVTGASVLISLIGFTLIYGALMIADIYLLTKYAKAGPSTQAKTAISEDDQLPSLVGAQD